mmetsp:Transcript_33315/g.86432  ORF Transcript_33315/g.86432 Transcript_33315/m.86432 type:complete len:214 (-) Transcript_33315:385-1026(-)
MRFSASTESFASPRSNNILQALLKFTNPDLSPSCLEKSCRAFSAENVPTTFARPWKLKVPSGFVSNLDISCVNNLLSDVEKCRLFRLTSSKILLTSSNSSAPFPLSSYNIITCWRISRSSGCSGRACAVSSSLTLNRPPGVFAATKAFFNWSAFVPCFFQRLTGTSTCSSSSANCSFGGDTPNLCSGDVSCAQASSGPCGLGLCSFTPSAPRS